MARTKAAGFETQRAAIRDAATRLFAEKGYASASIADLARACGVSKALMYHYYRDKEALLADIALSYVERLAAIVDEVAARNLPPAAHLRRLIEAFMAEYEHSAARHRVLVQDVKYLERAHRSRVLARQRKVVDGFAAVIARLAPEADPRRTGEAPDDDPVRHDQLDLHLAEGPRTAGLRRHGADRRGSVPRRHRPRARRARRHARPRAASAWPAPHSLKAIA